MRPKFDQPRLKFPPGKQRKFLEKVLQKSRLTTSELARILSVSSRTVRDWKREKYCISTRAINLFHKELGIEMPAEKEKYIASWRKARLEASRVGGFAHLEMYGSLGTPEGRRKGGKKAMQILRKRGVASVTKKFKYPQYGAKLAEWVGIILGDGCLTTGQVAISLNRIADKEYIPFVASLGYKLFGEKPRVFIRESQNTAVVYYSGIKLVNYLLELGLETGNKVRQQIKVPCWILKKPQYKKACLRGLMDTDGGIFIHKYKVGGKEYSYKKLNFSNRSLPILYFVADTLEELGFSPKTIDTTRTVESERVWLYNSNEVQKYLEAVGSHNMRLFRYHQGGVG